jgi:hypothetical protein
MDVPCVAGRPLKFHLFITPVKPFPLLWSIAIKSRQDVRNLRESAEAKVQRSLPDAADVEKLPGHEVLRQNRSAWHEGKIDSITQITSSVKA